MCESVRQKLGHTKIHTLEKMVKLLTVYNMAGSSFTAEAAAVVVVLL